MFNQVLNPLGNMAATAAVALVPLAVLLLLLVWLRRTAWLAALIGSVVTFLLAWLVWGMPLDSGARSYFYGSLNGAWAVDWITFWGLMLFNTLVITGRFERLRAWLVSQGTLDVRIQTLLFAWAFGALLEGLVGFGYPWAVVAPLLISLRIPDIDAIRVAAIANNAPVSYGALGAPIIALAAVTGLPLLDLSASVGYVVAVLALLPPWILIYLVSGRAGLRDGWPLAIVGSLAYVAGQLPVAVYLGPYLPDVTGSIVCFIALLALIKVWRPKTVLGYGGVPVSQADIAAASNKAAAPSAGEVFGAWLPFLVLIVVVVAWTGPWSSLPKISWLSMKVEAISSVTQKPITSAFDFKPYVGGTAIFASWLVVIA
ncbi:MAG: L-lactate permease, partial [Nevskiales bacterium]